MRPISGNSFSSWMVSKCAKAWAEFGGLDATAQALSSTRQVDSLVAYTHTKSVLADLIPITTDRYAHLLYSPNFKAHHDLIATSATNAAWNLSLFEQQDPLLLHAHILSVWCALIGCDNRAHLGQNINQIRTQIVPITNSLRASNTYR